MYKAYTFCLLEYFVIFFFWNNSVRAIDTKSCYFPTSSLVFNNFLSCTNNPQTGYFAHGLSRVHSMWMNFMSQKLRIGLLWCENYHFCLLTFWRRNYYFFLVLAHTVYKMWIIQEPNTLELWNKLYFEEKRSESIYHF